MSSAELPYADLFDAAPDAIVVVGTDNLIKLVNHQTEVLFGYLRAELIGQPLELLIPERFRPGHHHHTDRFFAAPTSRPMGSGLRLFGRRKDGVELPIEVSLSPQPSGKYVAAAIRDITERRALEQALSDASAAKSEFLSSMSHELRTPLNAILGFAQLLERDRKEPLSARHKERVGHILRGGEHLLRLIDDILDLARIEAGKVTISPEPVSVSEVLGELRRTLEPIAARHEITLAIDVPAASSVIRADRTRFAQILMNLGSNAIKYNRPGGEVRFAVETTAAGTVRVTVSDTGVGIPIADQDKLFQPFQRAGQENGPIEGTGIGLVITRRLAHLMNGEVGFTSIDGEGSRFWIELPEAHELATLLATPATRQVALPAGDHLILYVEDNPANVQFMVDLMSMIDGIELATVPTAELGIELARARQPRLIIMDINLPGMSGLDAFRVLKTYPETFAIPVIALTAAAAEPDRIRGLEAGFYRYLTKPVQADELVSAIETLLVAR